MSFFIVENHFCEYCSPTVFENKTLLSNEAVQTQKILSEISVSLSNLAQEIDRMETESKLARSQSNQLSIITSQGEERFWESYTTPLILADWQKLAIAIAIDIT